MTVQGHIMFICIYGLTKHMRDSTTASISATAFNDDGDPYPYSGTGNNSCTAKRSGSFAGTQASYRLGASTVKTLVVGNV